MHTQRRNLKSLYEVIQRRNHRRRTSTGTSRFCAICKQRCNPTSRDK